MAESATEALARISALEQDDGKETNAPVTSAVDALAQIEEYGIQNLKQKRDDLRQNFTREKFESYARESADYYRDNPLYKSFFDTAVSTGKDIRSFLLNAPEIIENLRGKTIPEAAEKAAGKVGAAVEAFKEAPIASTIEAKEAAKRGLASGALRSYAMIPDLILGSAKQGARAIPVIGPELAGALGAAQESISGGLERFGRTIEEFPTSTELINVIRGKEYKPGAVAEVVQPTAGVVGEIFAPLPALGGVTKAAKTGLSAAEIANLEQKALSRAQRGGSVLERAATRLAGTAGAGGGVLAGTPLGTVGQVGGGILGREIGAEVAEAVLPATPPKVSRYYKTPNEVRMAQDTAKANIADLETDLALAQEEGSGVQRAAIRNRLFEEKRVLNETQLALDEMAKSVTKAETALEAQPSLVRGAAAGGVLGGAYGAATGQPGESIAAPVAMGAGIGAAAAGAGRVLESMTPRPKALTPEAPPPSAGAPEVPTRPVEPTAPTAPVVEARPNLSRDFRPSENSQITLKGNRVAFDVGRGVGRQAQIFKSDDGIGFHEALLRSYEKMGENPTYSKADDVMRFGYDPQTETLHVVMAGATKGDAVPVSRYVYRKVTPESFNEFSQSTSKSDFLNAIEPGTDITLSRVRHTDKQINSIIDEINSGSLKYDPTWGFVVGEKTPPTTLIGKPTPVQPVAPAKSALATTPAPEPTKPLAVEPPVIEEPPVIGESLRPPKETLRSKGSEYQAAFDAQQRKLDEDFRAGLIREQDYRKSVEELKRQQEAEAVARADREAKEAYARELQETIKSRQLAGPESVTLTGTPQENLQTMLSTQPAAEPIVKRKGEKGYAPLAGETLDVRQKRKQTEELVARLKAEDEAAKAAEAAALEKAKQAEIDAAVAEGLKETPAELPKDKPVGQSPEELQARKEAIESQLIEEERIRQSGRGSELLKNKLAEEAKGTPPPEEPGAARAVKPEEPPPVAPAGSKPLAAEAAPEAPAAPSEKFISSTEKIGVNIPTGYTFELPRNKDFSSNPKAIKINNSTYPTIASEDGKVKIGLDTTDIFINRNEVWYGDSSVSDPNLAIISGITVEPSSRGQGLASKAIDNLIKVADSQGITLKLEPTKIKNFITKGDKSLTDKQLAEWYKRKGFEQERKGSDLILVRKPQQTLAETESVAKPAKKAEATAKQTQPVEESSLADKMIDQIDSAIDNLESKTAVVKIARQAAKEGLIEPNVLTEIERISKDRDMGVEDVGGELRSYLLNPKPATKATAPDVVVKVEDGKPLAKAPPAEEARVSKLATKKQLKEQKQFILSAVDELIAKAPEKPSASAGAKVTIAVPGDGTFTVENTKSSLASFGDIIDKRFDKIKGYKPPKPAAVEPRTLTAVKKNPTAKDMNAVLDSTVSTDKTRPTIQKPSSDGIYSFSTDGARMNIIVGADVKPIEGFPNIRQVIPKTIKLGEKGIELTGKGTAYDIDTGKMLKDVNQAVLAVEEVKDIPIEIMSQPDGKLAIRASDPAFGDYNSATVPDSELTRVLRINGSYLQEALASARKLGYENAKIVVDDANGPVTLYSDSKYAQVVMPLNDPKKP